jgi:hypothetical protein
MSGREQGAVSLVTQDYQRIDSAGAAAWKIRGDSSHEDQHGGYTDVRGEGQVDSDLWLALRDMASQVVANPGHRGSGLLQTDAGLQSRDGPEVVTAALLEIA